MTDKKTEQKEFANDVLIADIMLRVTAMEKLLIDKGILTQQELSDVTEEIAKRVAKVVLDKAKGSKSVDDFVSKLELNNKTDKDFKN